MSVSSMEQLDRQMRTAARRQEPLAQRTASIRNLQSLLRTSQGQTAGQTLLPALWPAAIMLLQDSQPEVRQVIAPVVGFLGALAARPGRPAGVSPSLLFEWALPVLSGTANIPGWSSLDIGVQCWVLVALKEGLAAVDKAMLNQHAHAVMNLCLHRLKSEATSVHLVAPLLGLVSEAAENRASLRITFPGLVDCMVAWWLESKLPDVVRPLLARTMDSMKAGWQQHPAFGKAVMGRLLQHMGKAVADRAPANAGAQTHFTRLNNCAEAVLAGSASYLGGEASGLMRTWAQYMEKAYRKFSVVLSAQAARSKGSQTPPTDAFAEHLCTHMQCIITHGAKHGAQPSRTPSQPSAAGQKASTASSSSATQAPHVIQPLVKPVVDFVCAVMASTCNKQQAATARRVLKLAQSLVEALQQQRCTVPAGLTQQLFKLTSSNDKVKVLSDPQVMLEREALQGLLLKAEPTKLAVVQQMAGAVFRAFQTLADTIGNGGPDRASASAKQSRLAAEVAAIQQTISASEELAVSSAVWQCLAPVIQQQDGWNTASPELWLAILSLLHLCWKHAQPIGLHQLMPKLERLSTSLAHADTHCLLINWVADAAIHQEAPQSASDAPSLTTVSTAAQSQASSDQVDAAMSGKPPQSLSIPEPCFRFLTQFCRSQDPKIRQTSFQALLQLLQHSVSPDSQQLLALTILSCQFLTDTSDLVNQTCVQLLSTLAASAAHAISSCPEPSQLRSPWRRLVALQPQQLPLESDQLAKLLDWMSQTAPLVVSQPVRVLGLGDEWLWRLLKACQTDKPDVKLPRTSGDAAWLAVQEAAKHCTAVRMRTHLGNPAQTFAALEHMLQGMLSKLDAAPSAPQTDPTGAPSALYAAPAVRTGPSSALLEPSMMLLEFMHALEKNMYCTYAGSCLRPGFSGNAVAFYKSNRKVCEDWFARMRMLLLRTSAASSSHALTVYHAYARLSDLKGQLRHLQAAAAAEAAQQQAERQQAERQEADRQQAKREAAAKQETEQRQVDKQQVAQSQHEQLESATGRSSSQLPPVEALTPAVNQTPVRSSASSIPSISRQTVPPDTPHATRPSPPMHAAPKSLLEIQAEQEAESAQAAAARAAASSPAKRRSNKQEHGTSANSPAFSSSSDSKSQARVLQVKRQKPGQNTAATVPAANGATANPVKVLPLPRNAAGKAAAPESAPVPVKIKLMARPQNASGDFSKLQMDEGLPGSPSLVEKHVSAISRARKARAVAAHRIGKELQEVLRHASLALLRLMQPETITGLEMYCSSTFEPLYQLASIRHSDKTETADDAQAGQSDSSSCESTHGSHFKWLQALALQAASRHEEAAAMYGTLTAASEKGIDKRTRSFLMEHCCEAYSSVADWTGLQQWAQDSKGPTISAMIEADGLLSPAKEHVYDALAAFDRGQIQEAQHAFDLSVWADIRSDRDGVNAAEAAEASTLKALMQLHTSAPAKQRAGRDRRLVRSMLQDAKDTLLQSLAVVSASDIDQAVPHLIQLHCLTAVQDSIPAAAPVLPASDAPPGFAPKPAEMPVQTQFSLTHHLWPFNELSDSNSGPSSLDLLSVQDPKSLLQLLRVHTHLSSQQDQSAQQHLLLAATQSATAASNFKLAQRLVQDMQVGTDADIPQQHAVGLIDLQVAVKSGSTNVAAAAQKLSQRLQRQQISSTGSDSQPVHTSVRLQMLLQLALWSTEAASAESSLRDNTDVNAMLKQHLGPPSIAPSQVQPAQEQPSSQVLPVALTSVTEQAAAWLVYADYLHALIQPPRRTDTAGQRFIGTHDQVGQPQADALQGGQVEVFQAYSMQLFLACQTAGPAGVLQDCTSVLLKLLELVVIIAADQGSMQAATEASLRVPVLMWRAVVPQLFALVAHEESSVSQLGHGLLQSLSHVDAASVVFPALVESKRIEKGLSRSRASLTALMEGFQTGQPDLLQQVKQLMAELERVSVLAIEQWHITLLDIQAEVARRIPLLHQELKLISHLAASPQQKSMHDRYQTVFAPAIHMLKQSLSLHATTTRATPLEEEFVSKTLPALRQAAAAFCKPADNTVMHPETAWHPFKAVMRSIAQQLSARELQLAQLSPVLTQLTSTTIPMPGLDIPILPPRTAPARLPRDASTSSLDDQAQPEQTAAALPDGVTIAGFKPAVHVMSTKTRPKRLSLLGSDGKTYTFLLKGWEDLRLDERLMQMVGNFASTLQSTPETARKRLLPKPLSITPLGPSMGLIQWVDHTMPLYGVYKAWQHRQIADQAGTDAEQAEGQAGSKPVPQIPRAADAFYAKLFPALEAAGLSRSTPRKEWPVPLLRQVLSELVQETPHHLLARELWCGTGSASEWWSFQAGYTTSTAAMSMVGYLMGLGDRHLDNILLNKHTGRVVHIDYNIIFDKGQQLRVPEIVPFRLTPMVQAALGVTGMEGLFRKGCESILTVTRKNADALSRLMQAVLTDPLVCWSGEKRSGSKKDWDAAVTLNLFCARLAEQDQPLADALPQLGIAVTAASAALSTYITIHADADAAATAARTAHQQIQEAQAIQAAAVTEAEALTRQLRQAQAALPQLDIELQGNQQLLQSHLRDCQGWADRHHHIVHALRDQLPSCLMLPEPHWIVEQAPTPLGLVMTLGPQGSLSALGAALHTAPTRPRLPPQLLQQAYGLDQQASALFAQRQPALLAGVAGLQAYSAALRVLLQPGYITSSHHYQWAQAIDAALKASDSQAVSAAVVQAPPDPSPANALAAWEALKLLPSRQAAVLGHLKQKLSQASGQKQQAQSALTDAEADLQECLAEAQAEGSSIPRAVQACFLAAANEHKVDSGETDASEITSWGFANLAHHLEAAQAAPTALLWVADFVAFLRDQATVKQDIMLQSVPLLLAYQGQELVPDVVQFLESVQTLNTDMAAIVAAEDHLQSRRLEHAELIVSYSDQAAELPLPSDAAPSGTDAKLQQLHAAWADRHTTAADLAADDQALADRMKAATSKAWSLLIESAAVGQAKGQGTDPLHGLWAAASHMAGSLYSIAEAAEALPGQQSLLSPRRAADHSWKASVFAVNTTYTVVNSILQKQPPELSASAAEAPDAASLLDGAVQCLDQALYRQLLMPCLLAQLTTAAQDLSITNKQQESLDLQSTSHILEDLSHLELEPATDQAGQMPSCPSEPQTHSSELKPFMDFDPSLPGADESLESAPSQQQLKPTDAPDELVAFTDFDPSLEGADQLLELDTESQDSTPPAGSQTGLSSAAQVDAAAQHGGTLGNESLEVSLESQQGDNSTLAQAMLQFVQCAGRMRIAEQVKDGMDTASSKLQQLMLAGQGKEGLVRFEWMHEPSLQQALQLPDGLGQPAVISPPDPNAVPSWSLSSRRSHILRILDQVLDLLSSVEEGYLSWQQTSARMEANLLSHLVGNQDQYNAFSQLLQDRQQWLSSCAELTVWLDSTIQSVLQLERSREGFVWSRSGGSDQQSFADCAGLLQQRLQLLDAHAAAQREVAAAQELLPSLEAQAAAAAAQLQPAQVQQKQQGLVYAQQAPKLLQAAEALLAPVKECQAAVAATGPRLETLQKELSQLARHIQGSPAAVSVAEAIAAMDEQLKESCKQTQQAEAGLAGVLTALENVSGPGRVLSNDRRPWKGPQSKAKRAALVMDALKNALPGADQLANMPQLDQSSLEKLKESLKAIQQQAKSVATNIEQAQSTSITPAVAALPSASQVADAQPLHGSTGSAVSLNQLAPIIPPDEPVGTSVKGSSTTEGSTQKDSQPGVAASGVTHGEDAEQEAQEGLGFAQSAIPGRLNEQEQQAARQAEDAQRQAFAEATLSAFRRKLAGHDMSKSQGEGMSHDILVEEHVDQLIKQATSLTNLCRMYEGWTAWI